MAETAKIRVDVEVVELEVNDKGDTIKLPVSDELFIKKLYNFTAKIAEDAKELENLDKDNILEAVDKDIKFHESLKEQFDVMFGENAYEKVFGEDIVVGVEYVMDFLEQCMPFIQKYISKRETKLNKYSADRVGSSL